ncbi:MAG: ABC transporter permease [Tepidisphaeraceae bacterium]|jgi:putative ABC transport system permease protein
MRYWMIVKVALKCLSANKLRSMLAMLGIIIGVGAVIAMLAIGSGAEQQVMSRINAMGTNLLIIRPGQRGFGGVMSGTQQNLTVGDAEALLDVPGVKSVSPVVNGGEQVKYMSLNTHTNIMGVAPTYFEIRDYEVDEGEFFNDNDTEVRMGRVAILGPKTVENLFVDSDPIGKTIKINGINFVVVATFKSKGDQGFFNQDDQILIPYRTAIKELFGVTSTTPNSIREIDVEAQDGADVTKLQDAISLVLRTQHKLQPDMPDDVDIRSQAEYLETASQFVTTFTILLGSVAGISLLVGGIGIMNIMLVTVTERTREIGVRKAIGARDRDILNQFLIEALIMSGTGGLIGVLAGVGAADLIGIFSPFPSLVRAYSIFVALIFSGTVGVFFGYYPATRAAKLDPIEALRYE